MSNRIPATTHAFQALIPLGVLVAATTVGASRPFPKPPGDGSVLPGAATGSQVSTAPAQAAKEHSVSSPASLQIVALRAGRGPHLWRKKSRIAVSFVTDTAESLEVVAAARLPGHPEADDQIRWEISPPAGFQVPAGARLKGGKIGVRLLRSGGNPAGAGCPLSLTMTARLERESRSLEAAAVVQQDPRDRLRQEYVDLQRAWVPGRADLLDEKQFNRRYGKKYRVGFAELNWSRQPPAEPAPPAVDGPRERYPFILATEKLLRTLHETRKAYSRPLVISSGFRNPVRQVEVHAAVEESYHQYGRAADLYVAPDSTPPRTGRAIAREGDWLYLAASALRGGGVWIEPMLDCHVNTNGCHVHVDVRERGPRSRLIRLAGKVTDPSGNPVPGALVRLAGMPCWTNARGGFVLKHVLLPREYEVEVEAPGRETVTQKVLVGAAGQRVAFRVPADPQPTVTARAETAGMVPSSGRAAILRITLKNVGLSEACGVRASVAAEDPRKSSVREVLPSQVASIAPDQEASFQVKLALPGRRKSRACARLEVPLKVTAAFTTPGGTPWLQKLPLMAAVTLPPAPAERSMEPAPKPPVPPRQTAPLPPGGPDLGAAASGMAAGGAAAAVGALAKRRIKPQEAPPEPSVDPAPEQTQ